MSDHERRVEDVRVRRPALLAPRGSQASKMDG